MDETMTGTLQGSLVFHSETGTEGGYWAFQDEEFTHRFDESCWLDDDSRCPTRQRETSPGSGEFTSNGSGTGPRRADVHQNFDGLHVLDDGDVLTVWDVETGDVA